MERTRRKDASETDTESCAETSVWAPTRKSLEQWSNDFRQGHTVTQVNLENDDAFSFFVEHSFSGDDGVLYKARHDDQYCVFIHIMPAPACVVSMVFVPNDRPRVERDEFHYERKEELLCNHQPVQKAACILS